MEILKDYREYLERLVKEKSTDIFTNGDVSHASILMSVLFDNTKNNILMFCNGLNPKLTKEEPYNSSFKNYIKNGGKLSLLIETSEYQDEDMFKFLKEYESSNIQIKQIQGEDKMILFENLKSKHCNFSVFDDTMIRFEYDPENYAAFGSFNLHEMANTLSGIFNAAFDNAIPYSNN